MNVLKNPFVRKKIHLPASKLIQTQTMHSAQLHAFSTWQQQIFWEGRGNTLEFKLILGLSIENMKQNLRFLKVICSQVHCYSM